MSRSPETDRRRVRAGADARTPGATAPHPFSMTWRDGLFAHWPLDPVQVRPHVPDPLTIDTYDGDAWVSALPFVLARAGIRGSPSMTRLTVPELNLRTYVRLDGDPGLYFFSVDVDSALIASIVGRATRVPCFYATMRIAGTDGRIAFTSRRVHRGAPSARFEAAYRPAGDAFRPKPGSLAHWLVERRRFYAPGPSDVLTAEIAHDPWPLQPATATIHENTLFEAAGLPTPTADPVCHYCGDRSMTGSIPRRR